MKFLITLSTVRAQALPVNYNYPLSAAIYRIIAKSDAEYAAFIHEAGHEKALSCLLFTHCPARKFRCSPYTDLKGAIVQLLMVSE